MINGKERVLTLAMGFGLVSESVRQVVTNCPPNSETIIFNALMCAAARNKEDKDNQIESRSVGSDSEVQPSLED